MKLTDPSSRRNGIAVALDNLGKDALRRQLWPMRGHEPRLSHAQTGKTL
jgi:hypothetical protein